MNRTFKRRQFLQLSTASALAAFGSAGISRAADDKGALYQRVIPARKNLPARWLASLITRGGADDAPIISSDKAALPHIGMTVGGIGCGSVYLSGDGRLFVWDIFNRHETGIVPNTAPIPKDMVNIDGAGNNAARAQDGASYISPPTPDNHPAPFRQSFSLRVADKQISLDGKGFAKVGFTGRWPLGAVSYDDPGCPLAVRLEAWSPFIPLKTADSSLPVTVLQYTVTNTSKSAVKATLCGLLENPVLVHSRHKMPAALATRFDNSGGLPMICHGVTAPPPAPAAQRKDILFTDFESAGYDGWTVEGTAFGTAPLELKNTPSYQGDLGAHGARAVNSHSTAPGNSIQEKDAAVGSLTSKPFAIARKYISCRIGGGNKPGETGMEVLIDGKSVGSITGPENNHMVPGAMDVSQYEGKQAQLRIFDRARGPWGNVGIDEIIFTDAPPQASAPEQAPDFGTMVLACLDPQAVRADQDGIPGLAAEFALAPGQAKTVTYLIAWHFPNLGALPGLPPQRSHYVTRFADAAAVARYVAKEFPQLENSTRGWEGLWNDSTLPQWLLDRSALTTNTLQTANCYILETGRFWAWEGVGCCAGTCGHVWHYAQGPARLFPDLERNLREVTDYGVAMNPDGSIRFRAEAAGTVAIDAQTGVILRTWREHLCSEDDNFLKRVWPAAKRAIEWLIRFDTNGRGGLDGLLDGSQHNTLDAEWYGKVHCLCSLYLASLRAGEEMARTCGDPEFADQCASIHAKGADKIASLFNGEYYEQEEDPAHLNAIGVGKGCYIDQVIGQWWAWQTGLGRLYDQRAIRSALASIWKYNFLADIGPFRKEFAKGRFYALPGEGGTLMCTWPRGGLRDDFKKHWQYGYFNECMSGFEWQAAAHMIFEGAPVSAHDAQDAARIIDDPNDPRALTLRGLAAARSIHDRYAPAKRNPYNEIECSDHYARAAASYSILLAACGFSYNGPRGTIGFAPRIAPEDFRAPFITAAGWGTWLQKRSGNDKWTAALLLRHGSLRLARIDLPFLTAAATATLDGTPLSAAAGRDSMTFNPPLELKEGHTLAIHA